MAIKSKESKENKLSIYTKRAAILFLILAIASFGISLVIKFL